MQVVYHGSPRGGLKVLKPQLSEHGRPYVYFSENPNVALLYAVKPVPKPFSFYPFGFDKTGNPVYTVYFRDAFSILYRGRKGYLYECRRIEKLENPTQIRGVTVCTEAVPVKRVTEIPDVYIFLKEQEALGNFSVKPFSRIGEKEMDFARRAIRKEMEAYGLKQKPEDAMSIFIRTRFPEIWAD